MATAFAVLRKGKVFIQGNSKNTTGLWIADGEVRVAELDDTKALGAHILAALASSRYDLPHPNLAFMKQSLVLPIHKQLALMQVEGFDL
jgi:hypothetical protein